jgi:hypothetical protein
VPPGNLGRNSIPGPGYWDIDASLARSFPLRGEGPRLEIRADAFNVFNHANLGAPNNLCVPNSNRVCSSGFGTAYFGVAPQTTGFAALAPLTAQQRQIQLQVRLYF